MVSSAFDMSAATQTPQRKNYNMKTFFFSVVIFCLLFCMGTSLSAQNYADEAKKHEFGYYFSGISGRKSFSNLDLAYSYMNEASSKISQVSGKKRAKGGGAILEGASPKNRDVRIVYFMEAFGTDGKNVLTNTTADISKELKDNVGVLLVFMIFTGNKMACFTSYYVKQGFQFNNNSWANEFTADGNKYTATYQRGWTLQKVCDYLKG